MIIIGESRLIFDVVYIFGQKKESQYIQLPPDCNDNDAFQLFMKEVEKHPGDVVVCTQAESYIEEQFLAIGMHLDADYYFFSGLKMAFMEAVKRTGVEAEEATCLWLTYSEIFYTPHGRYHPCHHPLYEAEIADDGDVYTCCSAIMPYMIGNVQKRNFKEIWHSVRAKLLRLSALNGTAVFCSREKCGQLLPCDKKAGPHREQVSDYPLILNVAIDPSCNLACPSCRTGVITATKESVQDKLALLNNVEDTLYQNLQDLYVAGNGECMISEVYQNFLLQRVMKSFSGNLHLVTNGQIWNNTLVYSLVSKFRPEVLISVDAWDKSTYETLRYGGCYENILANIKKYVTLKKQGSLSCVTTRFVVQEFNYREIPEFINNMNDIGVDRMEFTRLVNGGAFASGAFERASLLDADGELKHQYVRFFEENVWPLLRKDVALDVAFLPKGDA